MIDGNRLNVRLSDRELDELGDFLEERCMPHGGMPISMLDGYLTAIASCPDMVPPSRWLPAVWEAPQSTDATERDEPDGFAFDSVEEAQRYSTFVMRSMNEIARNFDDGAVEPIFVDKVSDDGSELVIASIWCAGYVNGMRVNLDAWQPLLEPGSKDETLFVPIFELASPLLGDDEDDGDEDEANESALRSVIDIPDRDKLTEFLPGCVCAIYERSIACRQPMTPMTVRVPAKPGRNESCSCGSGKKYKKCCGIA